MKMDLSDLTGGRGNFGYKDYKTMQQKLAVDLLLCSHTRYNTNMLANITTAKSKKNNTCTIINITFDGI